MPKGIKGFCLGHRHSKETKNKIGNANRKPIFFYCAYCHNLSVTKPSAYNKKRRHFCSMKCYSAFRRELLPKEEQHAFGHGLPSEERIKRIKTRSDTNHAIRSHKLFKQPCQVCGSVAQVHHLNYDDPLNIEWLCFQHHRALHYENKDLLEATKCGGEKA